MISRKHAVGAILALTLGGSVATPALADAAADLEAREQDQDRWRETMARNPSQDDGCFHASYPSLAWEAVACVAAPSRVYVPRDPRRAAREETVGNGNDYVAKVSGTLIERTVGSFPTVTGVSQESDPFGQNDYSIQLNSNFMAGTAVCKGSSGCQSWLQFVYTSGSGSAFMQYWLIGVDSCPSGWSSGGEGCCVQNSKAVSVPDISVTDLNHVKMSGAAVKGGKDTLVFTNGLDAYTTNGSDSVADLATAWTESEFNIIGDGDASKAVFNAGTSLTVKISVTDGSATAPTCAGNNGTTGETNNLSLGTCTATGGLSPYIEFVESYL